MRKMKFAIGLLLVGGLFFNAGCKKEAENIVDSFKTSISADIDGQSWFTESVTVTKNGNGVVIAATKGDEVMTLTLPKTEVGKYSIDQNTTKAVFMTGSGASLKVYTAGSGTIEITAIIKDGKEFEGKFDFIALNPNGDVKIASDGSMVNIAIPK